MKKVMFKDKAINGSNSSEWERIVLF